MLLGLGWGIEILSHTHTLRIAGSSYLATGKEVNVEDYPLLLQTATMVALTLVKPEERQKVIDIVNRNRKLSRDLNRVVRDIAHMGVESSKRKLDRKRDRF